jgi:signal transduction histidine kinase
VIFGNNRPLNWRRLADELAAWSWWRFIGISIVILIAGSILDGVFIGDQHPGHIQKAHDAAYQAHKKKAQQAAPQSQEAAKDAPAAAAPATDPDKVSITVSLGEQRKPITIDIRGTKDSPEIQDAIREVTDAIAEASDASDGANLPAAERAGRKSEPFSSLAKLLVVTLLILKIIGGTRRERLAHQAADAAGAASEEARLQQELAQTRLRQMQAQIEPHFLFNTLAALQRLITTAPDRAATMNRHLIDWLRGSLAEMRQDKTNLGQEADLLRSYLSLMQVRFEERLTWEIDVADGLRAESIPALLLQPLVENAITHGIEPKPEGGKVRVSARMEAGALHLRVEDSGVGFAAQAPSSGIGLTSVRERLRLTYGERAKLTIQALEGGGTVVEIVIPVR